MKIDFTKLIQELRRKPADRAKTSINVSKKLWEEFRKSCMNRTPSEVLEILMEAWVNAVKKEEAGS